MRTVLLCIPGNSCTFLLISVNSCRLPIITANKCVLSWKYVVFLFLSLNWHHSSNLYDPEPQYSNKMPFTNHRVWTYATWVYSQASTNQAKGFEPLSPVVSCITRKPQKHKSAFTMTPNSYSQGRAQVNQSIHIKTQVPCLMLKRLYACKLESNTVEDTDHTYTQHYTHKPSGLWEILMW